MFFDIGNVKTNIDGHSVESLSDLDKHRRATIEAKLYYLRDTNSPEEFDYVVEAEMRRGESREFGLPAKEFIRRMKYRIRRVFKSRRNVTSTIHKKLQLSKPSTKSSPAVLQKTNKSAPKQTWENSPQAVAAAMLAY